MSGMIDKYNQPIGIFLVLVILAGGGGIIWKNSKFQNPNSKQTQTIANPKSEIQNGIAKTIQPQPSKVNINTASQKELESLPGIGEVKAKAIINYRQKNGKFETKKDIIKVKGIGEKTYKKIEDKIEI